MDECLKNFNHYCYMCGKWTIMSSKKKITDEIATLYEQYFNIPVIHNVDWVPKMACSSCVARLYDWRTGRRESMPYGIPMIWSEPLDHEKNMCYVCKNYVVGMNRRKAMEYIYQSVPSAQTTLPHSPPVPIPRKPSPTEEYIPPSFFSEPESNFSLYQPSNITPPCKHIEVTQQRLNIMSRQLKLSQNKTIILAQHLKAVNILSPEVKVFGSRGRQHEFLPFFTRNENNSFTYCNDINGLMSAMNYTYNADQWRLFIDGSKSSLKAVLLYFDNTKNSVPIALAVKTKETYDSMKLILDSVKYHEHCWKICADLKVVALICGLQTGYTKNMCYLCTWDSRYTPQYQKRDWLPRTNRLIGQQNVIHEELVPMDKVLLPPLHIKLGLMKNFIKALLVRGNRLAFGRLEYIFPRLSEAKIKEGK